MSDLPTALRKFDGWRVVARDESGDRVVLVDGKLGGATVTLPDGVLYDVGKRGVDTVLSSSGTWTDEGLPSISDVLERVDAVRSV